MYVLICGQLKVGSMRPFSYTEIRFANVSASDSMDFLGLLCKFLIEYTTHGMIASILSSRSEHDVPKMPLALSDPRISSWRCRGGRPGNNRTPRWLGK